MSNISGVACAISLVSVVEREIIRMSESSVNNSTSVNIRKVEEDSKQISDSNNKNEMNYLNQPDAEDVPEKPIPSPTFPTDGHQIGK